MNLISIMLSIRYNTRPCMLVLLKMKRMILFYKLIFIILLAFLSVACVTRSIPNVSKQEQESLWANRQLDLAQITAFQASGSLTYFSEETRHYGRFFIQQQRPNEYQLKLTTPIGTSIFSLIVTPYLAELTDNDGNQYIDENVERLMLRLTGIDMPLNMLHNWLIGLSNDKLNDLIDEEGRLIKTNLQQNGQIWDVSISKYSTAQSSNRKIDLPAIIELTKPQSKVQLKINNWKLN